MFVPALRCIGNFATTNTMEVIDYILFNNALDVIQNILQSPNSNLIKECCWVLSNIAASQSEHVKVIVEHSIFERLIQICLLKNIDNRKEALWVLTNAITGADIPTRERIFTQSANVHSTVKALVDGLML